MILLFEFNINRLEGVVRMLWAPFMVFGSIFLFSLGNLVFSRKA